MDRAEFKRMMKARVHAPSIGMRHSRQRDRQQVSEKLRRDTEAFLSGGGQIQRIENQKSEFKPTWHAYAVGAYEGRDGEA